VGGGLSKPELIKRAKEYGLRNIPFWPFQLKDAYIKILKASDACLVTLKEGYNQPVVPSKIIEIMAAGKPVIAALPSTSDAVRIIKKSGAGILVEPSNPATIKTSNSKLL